MHGTCVSGRASAPRRPGGWYPRSPPPPSRSRGPHGGLSDLAPVSRPGGAAQSNWAIPLESAPFYAFPVTYGITFTFGGLHADTDGRVLDTAGAPIPGLFVCGEMLGGLFSGNYPGGTGLTSGAVFGRRPGSLA